MNRALYLIPVLLLVVLAGIMGKRLVDVDAGADPQKLDTVLLDTPLPEMNLPPLPERPPGIVTEDMKGEVALVNIWGSWCIACLSEHPTFMRLAEADVVPIHGIAWRDDPDASLRWLDRHGDPYRRIGQDPRSDAAIALGVTGAPETFIIDTNGVIRHKYVGPVTDEVWASELKPIVDRLRQ